MNTRMKVNARTMTLARQLGSWGVGALLAPALGACAGEVMVGDVNEGTGGVHSSAAAVSCAEEDAELALSHERWLATGNDFGDLAGSRWEGTMAGMPTLVLELGTDQNGTLVVGTPVSAVAKRDEAYFAWTEPYPVGGTFPLHGASFDGSELLLPVPTKAPIDVWCALQPPMSQMSEFPCEFTPALWAECDGESCTLEGGRKVTGGWYANSDACICTSKECFAEFFWPKWDAGETFADHEKYFDLPVLRLTYDPETDTLEGAHFPEGSPPPGGSDGIEAKFVRAE